MGVETGIEYVDHTWSSWRGCAKISPGCKLCYAEAGSRRNPAVMGTWGPGGVRVVNANWRTPLRWNDAAGRAGVRRRLFMSLCDWLEDRPDWELDALRLRLLELIAATPCLDWLLLTKRPQNFQTLIRRLAKVSARKGHQVANAWLMGEPPANVWLGVSVEDQDWADERIPVLLETPAALRWVSYEPALGPVDFAQWLEPAFVFGPDPDDRGATVPGLDWIVVGGESNQGGQAARPFDVDWARSTVEAGKAAGVPVFVKQLGSLAYDSTVRIGIDGPGSHAVACDIRHRKGADPDEWPADLRVQQLPTAAGRVE